MRAATGVSSTPGGESLVLSAHKGCAAETAEACAMLAKPTFTFHVLAWLLGTAVAGAQPASAQRIDAVQALTNDIEEIHRVDLQLSRLERELTAPQAVSQSPESRHRCDLIRVRVARLKQSAIGRAVGTYDIDVRQVLFGVSYSPHGGMHDREAATFVDADGTVRVEIGDEAFLSASWLGSTIGHEVEVHVNRQIVKRVAYPPDDEQGVFIQEVEAYDYELASKDRFGLSLEEVLIVKQRRASHYRRLTWVNRRQVDNGLYTK
jgi:hypothetical protein